MPLNQLHTAFLNFFKTIVQPNDAFNRPIGDPYLSWDGRTIVYAQEATENNVLFYPLRNALDDVYHDGVNAENFTTVNTQSLSLLMRFFDHIAAPNSYQNIRTTLRAPIYIIHPLTPNVLIDYQDLILRLLNFPQENLSVEILNKNKFIPAYCIYNAMQTLKREINLINLNDDIPQAIQQRVFEIKKSVDIISLNQQIAIWNEFSKFMSTREMIFYRMVRGILTDPHFQSVFIGVILCFITSYAAPSINNKYIFAFLFVWQLMCIQLLIQNSFTRNMIQGAYIGIILFLALREALEVSLKSNSFEFDFDKIFKTIADGLKSIFTRSDIQAAPLVLNLGVQWLSSDSKRYVPRVTQSEIEDVQHLLSMTPQ